MSNNSSQEVVNALRFVSKNLTCKGKVLKINSFLSHLSVRKTIKGVEEAPAFIKALELGWDEIRNKRKQEELERFEELLTNAFNESSGDEVEKIQMLLNLAMEKNKSLSEKNKPKTAFHARLVADDFEAQAEGREIFPLEERRKRMQEVDDILSDKTKLPPYKNKQHGGIYDSPIEYVEEHLGRYLKPFNGVENFLFQSDITRSMKTIFGTVSSYISADKKKSVRKYPQIDYIGDIFPSESPIHKQTYSQ